MNPTEARRAAQGFNAMLGQSEIDARIAGKIEVPATYTISILLSNLAGKGQGGKVTLRPEDFLLRRITWACTGDTPAYLSVALPGYSIQGRSVEVLWGDEFTQFLGDQPALISALFGDSQGFLDIEKPGIFFAGSQTLTIKLNRLFWPDTNPPPPTPPADPVRFDFVFQGVGLLPQGRQVSGSV